MADTTPTNPSPGLSNLGDLGNLDTPPPQSQPPIPPTIPSPSPDMRLNLNAEPTDSLISNLQRPPPISNIHPPTSLFHSKLFLPITLIILISLISLSFFFIFNKRQPKTNSRASQPSPSPTSSSTSGFSSLISSAPISPISPARNAQPRDAGGPTPQPTTDSSDRPPDIPPRVVFDIKAENDTFTPNQFTAYQGQVVVFAVSAVDKTYDIAIPELSIKKIIKQGNNSGIEFQATSMGLYTFTCSENCPGADTAKGLLMIKPGL